LTNLHSLRTLLATRSWDLTTCAKKHGHLLRHLKTRKCLTKYEPKQIKNLQAQDVEMAELRAMIAELTAKKSGRPKKELVE
jgi:hypothetical protein